LFKLNVKYKLTPRAIIPGKGQSGEFAWADLIIKPLQHMPDNTYRCLLMYKDKPNYNIQEIPWIDDYFVPIKQEIITKKVVLGV